MRKCQGWVWIEATTPTARVRSPPVALTKVSRCGSEGDPGFAHARERHRGARYAPRIVAVWARAVRALGAEPFYRTDWQNAASRAVARKLGLFPYGTDLSIS